MSQNTMPTDSMKCKVYENIVLYIARNALLKMKACTASPNQSPMLTCCPYAVLITKWPLDR